MRSVIVRSVYAHESVTIAEANCSGTATGGTTKSLYDMRSLSLNSSYQLKDSNLVIIVTCSRSIQQKGNVVSGPCPSVEKISDDVAINRFDLLTDNQRKSVGGFTLGDESGNSILEIGQQMVVGFSSL